MALWDRVRESIRNTMNNIGIFQTPHQQDIELTDLSTNNLPPVNLIIHQIQPPNLPAYLAPNLTHMLNTVLTNQNAHFQQIIQSIQNIHLFNYHVAADAAEPTREEARIKSAPKLND